MRPTTAVILFCFVVAFFLFMTYGTGWYHVVITGACLIFAIDRERRFPRRR